MSLGREIWVAHSTNHELEMQMIKDHLEQAQIDLGIFL